MGRDRKLKEFLSSQVMEDQQCPGKTRGREGDKEEEERNKGGKGCIKSRYCLLVTLLGSPPPPQEDGVMGGR